MSLEHRHGKCAVTPSVSLQPQTTLGSPALPSLTANSVDESRAIESGLLNNSRNDHVDLEAGPMLYTDSNSQRSHLSQVLPSYDPEEPYCHYSQFLDEQDEGKLYHGEDPSTSEPGESSGDERHSRRSSTNRYGESSVRGTVISGSRHSIGHASHNPPNMAPKVSTPSHYTIRGGLKERQILHSKESRQVSIHGARPTSRHLPRHSNYGRT